MTLAAPLETGVDFVPVKSSVIVLLLLLMPCFAVGQDLPRSFEGRRNMPMGFDLIHAGSMCLVVSARVEAGTFF